MTGSAPSYAPAARPLAAPPEYPGQEAFWAACRAHRLMLPWCLRCGEVHWYPRPFCPWCKHTEIELRQSPGYGRIYSVSITRRAGPEPYAIALITLDEGVTLLSRVICESLDSLRIDDPVEVFFVPTDTGPPVPVFKPRAPG